MHQGEIILDGLSGYKSVKAISHMGRWQSRVLVSALAVTGAMFHFLPGFYTFMLVTFVSPIGIAIWIFAKSYSRCAQCGGVLTDRQVDYPLWDMICNVRAGEWGMAISSATYYWQPEDLRIYLIRYGSKEAEPLVAEIHECTNCRIYTCGKPKTAKADILLYSAVEHCVRTSYPLTALLRPKKSCYRIILAFYVLLSPPVLLFLIIMAICLSPMFNGPLGGYPWITPFAALILYYLYKQRALWRSTVKKEAGQLVLVNARGRRVAACQKA